MTLKIRTWVLLAAAVVLAPMLLVFLLSLRYLDRAEHALADSEVRSRARELAQVLEERLAVTAQTLDTLADSDAAWRRDWRTLHGSATRLVAVNPGFSAVTLVEESGRILFDTAQPFGETPLTAEDPAPIRSLLADRRTSVSGPLRAAAGSDGAGSARVVSNPRSAGESPKRPVEDLLVAVSGPVQHEAPATHVLRIILRADSISALLGAQRLPEGWIAAVTDRDGTLVARSVAPEVFVGQQASPSLVEAIARNDRSIRRGASLEGTPITLMALPVHGGDWFAAVAVPDAVVEQRYRKDMAVVGIAFVSIAALAIAVALAVAGFLARQALALERVVGSGRADTQPPWPLRITELQRVAQSHREVSRREAAANRDLKHVTLAKDEAHDLFEHAPCGYHSIDPQGRIVRINQTELDWLGRSREEVLGRPITEFFTEEGKAVFRNTLPKFLAQGHVQDLELELVRHDGSTLPVLVNATLIRDADGRPVMSRSTLVDITERKKLEQRLERMSNTDALTGLSNRRHFYRLAAIEVERARRHGQPLSVAMLDIDHFKEINDRHGHASGDRLLAMLAEICRTTLRELDVVARLGGEEFGLLLPYTDLETALGALERLRVALESARLDSEAGAELGFTVSIGLTAWLPDENDLEAALRRADAALYEAKRLGRNQVRLG